MVRIFFSTLAGIGLGHIVRGINIAQELRRLIACDIVFITNTDFTEIFQQVGMPFVSGGLPTRDAAGAAPSQSRQDYFDQNDDFLLAQLQKNKVDILVIDTLILPRSMEYARRMGIFTVYIMREHYDLQLLRMLKKLKMPLWPIIIPHRKEYLDKRLIRALQALFLDKEAVYAGDIFRVPQPEGIADVKRKYTLRPEDLLITVTAGGGKALSNARTVFLILAKTALELNRYFSRKKLPLRWIFVKGPLAAWEHGLEKKLEFISYERYLPELMSLSAMVIASAGYNTINELAAVDVPAFVCPATIVLDDQSRRALEYSRHAQIRILDMRNVQGVYTTLRDSIEQLWRARKVLSDKKQNGEKRYTVRQPGALLASGKIVSSFLRSTGVGRTAAYLRTNINTVGENFIYEEAEALARYSPFFLCRRVVKLDQDIRWYGNTLLNRIPYRWPEIPLWDNILLDTVAEKLSEENVSVCHAQFITDALFFYHLLSRVRLPLVVSARGIDLYSQAVQPFLPRLFPLVSRWIVKSSVMKDLLIKKGVSASKIEVIYGGVSAGKIPFKPRLPEAGNLRILSAGRFVEKKGFFTTLRFFKSVTERFPQARLTLMGEGPLEQNIRAAVQEAGIEKQVIIKPYMPHAEFIQELYAHTLFVLPSMSAEDGDQEGIPNVLKEAMAAGLPVISTDHGGIPELVENGVTGFLARPGDSKGMMDALQQCLSDKAALLRILCSARFHVEKKFDVSESARKTEAVYDAVRVPGFIQNIAAVRNGGLPLQFRADLHLISGCNARCVMCDNWQREKKSSFSTEASIALLEDLKRFGVTYVRFHGQEPLLRKDSLALIRHAKKLGFRVAVKTNTLAMGSSFARSMARYLDILYVSVDSTQASMHDRMRGVLGSLRKNIRAVRSMKKYNPRIKVHCNTVITRLNYRVAEKILDLAAQEKIDRVSFVMLNKNNKADLDDLRLSYRDCAYFYLKVYPDVLEKSRQYHIPVSVDPYFTSLVSASVDEQLSALRGDKRIFLEEIRNFTRGSYGKSFYSKNVCYGVLDHVTIDWDGNVYPCCAMPRSHGTAIGNIRDRKFSQLWNDEKYARYRNKIMAGNCPYKDTCSRNFKETKETNEYMRNRERELSHEKAIIDTFTEQYEYSTDAHQRNVERMFYYAFSKSAFYAGKYAPFMAPGRSVDFSGLPITTRAEMKAAFPSRDVLINYFEKPYGYCRTSSVGNKAFFYARPLDERRFWRIAASFLNTGGWKLGDKWFHLTALNCLKASTPLKTFGAVSNSHNPLARNRIVIPPSIDYAHEPLVRLKEIHAMLSRPDCALIHANPNYLRMLLYAFAKHRLRLDKKFFVHSTYEVLLPSVERFIREHLDCEVYDQYGCSEIGPVCFRCRREHYHIFTDSVSVEVIPFEPASFCTVGRIIVTHIQNTVMPFVRYFTGDCALVEPDMKCPCGYVTPSMGKPVGREEEIVFYRHKILHPLSLDQLIGDIDNIFMYQLAVDNSRFVLYVMPERQGSLVPSEKIKRRFRRFFDDAKMDIRVTVVKRIFPEVSRGKYKPIIVKR